MKPAPFGYVRARSLDEVLDRLAEPGEECRLLAGGQSLIPALNLRLSAPALLLDLNRVEGLAGIAAIPGGLRIGAMTRHTELAANPLVAAHAPLLAQAAPHIAHAAIRNRGTIGGSLALADPAAELPACALALGATIIAASRAAGERRIAAADFFLGLYATALRPDELIVAVEVPTPPAGQRCVLLELARRQGDYAIVGLAATSAPCLVFFGVGPRPMRAAGAEAALATSLAAAQAALAQDLDPPDDLHGPAAFRMHLARVLLGRAVATLLG